ncbi:HXXEE domain-containing protein [Metabacillus litoralis]|uniref:HXXEE domain-containing protein n=1 Tax=Metabacillus litoralis TaxID=152268 RepID=A0A5C6W6I5_9BACI|nr:HXXEE domain-containing protein [Metabacillus litoralis]TXC93441.1 HXXEE domain-containing protein [Metabacillus litoralis]
MESIVHRFEINKRVTKNIVHDVQSWLLKTYTPGLYTAIFLVTPYTFYLLNRLN